MARAGLSPDAVVEAAARLADGDGGLDALTLARVAAAVGVRTPSLYSHVGGLDDLRRRLAVRGMREVGDAVRDAAVGKARGDALRAAADALRAYALAHPGTYAAAQRAPDPGDEQAVAAAGTTVAVFISLLAGYGLEDEDAIHATRAVRSAIHGFVTFETGGGFGMAESVDESFARMVAMLDAGLSSR
ncbi:TetR-like C-terminal domain-containing protein [Conexibacter sp. JD483]|uniref:TetR/AcrR family transcriptional regulator n=1 Tax=unclassified Conexibacter TaxID=2627773 RepID=UPI0027241EBD|nr:MULTISPECIES: TetR-like C-terminal domain-containing protein [unclassified Conexibacter]MDO8186982.1 TetR-like C-terminal domain-containing protein [Conexibacter sp. CPCC 205706]MDO8200700.1 TetR-like C-terminal domain-containing protein [Conexibacter sp. CPCC 205762]MDR9371475.1 TetR-like C-terminal domain-containing protein [Conexibacter sp. JD483]